MTALLVLLVWGMQIQRIHASNSTESVSSIVVSCDDARWDAADPRLPDSVNHESGWAALISFGRVNPRTDVAALALDELLESARPMPTGLHQTHRALLAARPSLDAVKFGREAARATTVPPPVV